MEATRERRSHGEKLSPRPRRDAERCAELRLDPWMIMAETPRTMVDELKDRAPWNRHPRSGTPAEDVSDRHGGRRRQQGEGDIEPGEHASETCRATTSFTR
jgi:hypothetical protein